VIYSSEAKAMGVEGVVAGIAAIVAVCICVLAAFLAANAISRVLGKIGMTIVVRVLGLILTAMAVQFLIVGISGATLGVIRGSAAHPYPSASAPVHPSADKH
jgi:multiple antibiotic resistance protein